MRPGSNHDPEYWVETFPSLTGWQWQVFRWDAANKRSVPATGNIHPNMARAATERDTMIQQAQQEEQ